MKTKTVKKIGLFGGSFNPPHMGHVNSIQMVKTRIGLDEVRIIPNWRNPLKKDLEGPSPQQRLTMTQLAFRDLGPGVTVDPTEIERKGDSFTIATVEFLQKDLSGEFFLIIGQDLLAELADWKLWETLLTKVNLVVTSRPGFEFPKEKKDLPPFLQPYVAEVDFNFVQLTTGKEIQFIQLPDIAISSSELRKLLLRGKKVDQYLPLAVENFIRENGLYQPQRDRMGDALKFTEFCGDILFSRKAIQLRGLDLRKVNAPSEYVIICSGTSTRHTASLAENLTQAVKEEFGLLPQSVEGSDEGRWVLIDYGTLIVHVFYDHIRRDYALENLWREAVDLNLKEKPAPKP